MTKQELRDRIAELEAKNTELVEALLTAIVNRPITQTIYTQPYQPYVRPITWYSNGINTTVTAGTTQSYQLSNARM